MNLLPTKRLHTEVLVAGGGAAGVAAAITAARQGHQVLLIEKNGFCGGGAVAGMSGTLCGIYEADKAQGSKPKQVVFGFLDEFKKEMEKRGGLSNPVPYGDTWTNVHDPFIWKIVADDFLKHENISVLYHTQITGVLSEGNNRIDGVIAHSTEGIYEIRSQITIDSSGDAQVAAMANMNTFVGDQGKLQNPTMIFRLNGVDVDHFLKKYGHNSIMPAEVTHLIEEKNKSGDYFLPRSKIFLFPTTRPNELLCNCTRVVGRDGRELNPILTRDISEAETEGRFQVTEYARFFRDHLHGCENSFINDTSSQVGVRQTRQIEGLIKLKNDDVLKGRKRVDGIARCPWPIELHTGKKPIVNWLYNDYYEIPYGCFVPEEGNGVLIAGRCLSAEHEAVASSRVTAQCFSYGHAIGHAASLCIKEKMEPRNVDAQELREILNKDQAQLD